MVVCGIHCNLSLFLLIRPKTCRSNGFLRFTGQNVRARKIGRVSEVLRARVNLSWSDLRSLIVTVYKNSSAVNRYHCCIYVF